MSATTGAVDLDECARPNRSRVCVCDPCNVCGLGKHTAVHGPNDGQPPGSEPWGHQYERSPARAPGDPAFALDITVRTRSGHTTHTVEVESLTDLDGLAAAVREAIDAWVERHASADSEGCTGVAATWCPVHGDCTCARVEGSDWRRSLNDEGCPLHGSSSTHGEKSTRSPLP